MLFTPRAGRHVPRCVPRSANRSSVVPARCEPLECRRLLAATLLKDVNPSTASAYPYDLTDVNGTLYFAVFSPPPSKSALYRSDGTAANTRPIFDVHSDYPPLVTELERTADGTLYFIGGTPYDSDVELYKTDGTAGGTVLVKDVYPGYDSSIPRDLTAAGNTVYFVADDGVHGEELWKSDGTEAGTVRLSELRPGGATADPQNLTAVGTRVFFTALSVDDDNTRDLWTSDGTQAGTRLVQAGLPPAASFRDIELAGVGGLLYFVFDDGTHGRELWRSDGTPGGTALVNDLAPGPRGSNPSALTADGATLLFSADADGQGAEVWRTAAAAPSPVALTDVSHGQPPLGLGELTPMNGSVFFRTASGALYRTDGAPATTTKLGDFPSTARHPMVVSGGKLYFAAADALDDTIAAYATDGTAAGTALLHTFLVASAELQMTPFRGGIALSAYDATTGRELWASDGTPAGTRLVTDINPTPQDSLVNFGSVGEVVTAPVVIRPAGAAGSRLLFLAYDARRAISLWATDGTTAGTAEVMQAGYFAHPRALASLGNVAVFAVEESYDPLHRAGLWVTDGTAQGTRQLTGDALRLEPFGLTSAADRGGKGFTASGGYVYFLAAPPADPDNYDLWRTDGTPDGTRRVADLPAAPDLASRPRNFTDVNGTLFFTARSGPQTQTQLWKSDGTEAGTVVVATTEAEQLTAAGGRLIFQVRQGSQRGLWSSDGTPAGTVRFATATGFPLNAVAPFAVLRNRVVFAGPARGQLGVSDGTPEGTTALKDVNTGQYPATLSSFRSTGDKVYFMANDLTHTGNELWVTDGSAAGTHLVREFAPGVASATIDMLHAADGLLYFTVRPTGPEGGELWVTDGTEAGTCLVEDVRPGPAPSAPRRAATFGDKLVFWADDGVHGYEPWVAPHAAAQPPRRAANRRTSYTDGTPRPTTTAAPRDFNRDGIVNWTDLLLARLNLGRRLALFDAPALA